MSIPRKMRNIPSVVLFKMETFANDDIKGKLYHRYANGHREIVGTKALMDGIADLVDGINYPEPTVQYREFIHAEENHPVYDKKKPLYSLDELGAYEGDIADFYILVESRNHANWQGMVYYVEDDETSSFQSEVELMAYIEKKATEAVQK